MRSVETRLHRRVFQKEGADLLVSVHFRRQDSTYRAELSLSDSIGLLGTRQLSTEAQHCSALDDSLALVVALLVDTPPERPTVTEPAPSNEAAPAGQDRLISEPPISRRAAPTPLVIPANTNAPREPWAMRAEVSALLALGLLPSLGRGLELAAALRPPRGPWLRLLGDGFAGSEAHKLGNNAGVRLSMLRFGLDVCAPLLGRSPVGLELCLGQRVGRIAASGVGFDHNRDSHRPSFSLSAGLDGAIPLTRYLGLVFGLRAEVPFTRDDFTARDGDGQLHELFRSAPLVGVVRGGLEVEL